MGDLTVSIVNIKGELEIRKVIGNRGLVFRFDKVKNRSFVVGKFSLKDRLNSREDLWVSPREFIDACRQATAIFISRYNKKSQPPQPHLQHAPA